MDAFVKSLVAALTLAFYSLAWLPGAGIRGVQYVGAALASGWEDGRKGSHSITGKAHDKTEE